MKFRLIILLMLALSLGCLVSASAQRKDELAAPPPFNTAPYRVGERLTYNVSFSNFNSAAHVELFIAGRGMFFNREGLQIRAHVETTGVVNAALYSINNDYTSYIDTTTGLPFRTQQVVREAGRTADTSSAYNEPAGTSAIPPRLRTGELPGTYDLISAFYRFRSLPLDQNTLYRFSVRTDVDQYPVELKVTGRQLVKTNVGSFETIVVQARVSGDDRINGYRLRIYFSNDERHVPVLITAQLSAGELRAELVASELPSATQTPAPAPTPPSIAVVPRSTPPAGTQPVRPQTSGPTLRPDPSAGEGDGASLLNDLPFKVGEQLNYNVYLSTVGQPVGVASFQVRSRSKYFNRDGLLFAARAQTTNAAARLFTASDQINSYVDPSTLLPFRTEMMLQEGSRRTNQTTGYDQDRGSAVPDKGNRIEIPVGTHDLLSVMYALRSFNLTPPKRNAVSLLVHNRPRTFFVTALRRETIELNDQKIPAVQLSLTTDDAQPDKYSLRLWVSEDRRRLPLRLTANTQLGPLRADLAIIPVVSQ